MSVWGCQISGNCTYRQVCAAVWVSWIESRLSCLVTCTPAFKPSCQSNMIFLYRGVLCCVWVVFLLFIYLSVCVLPTVMPRLASVPWTPWVACGNWLKMNRYARRTLWLPRVGRNTAAVLCFLLGKPAAVPGDTETPLDTEMPMAGTEPFSLHSTLTCQVCSWPILGVHLRPCQVFRWVESD